MQNLDLFYTVQQVVQYVYENSLLRRMDSSAKYRATSNHLKSNERTATIMRLQKGINYRIFCKSLVHAWQYNKENFFHCIVARHSLRVQCKEVYNRLKHELCLITIQIDPTKQNCY